MYFDHPGREYIFLCPCIVEFRDIGYFLPTFFVVKYVYIQETIVVCKQGIKNKYSSTYQPA